MKGLHSDYLYIPTRESVVSGGVQLGIGGEVGDTNRATGRSPLISNRRHDEIKEGIISLL